jgi:hypothetical protein
MRFATLERARISPKALSASALSRAAPRIHYNFFDDQSDRDRLVEPVRLSRKNGSGRNYRVIWAKSFGTPADPHDWQTRACRRPPIARSIHLRSLSMIVFGAYSHARWAESIFGGVTRILLTQIPVPVLVSR